MSFDLQLEILQLLKAKSGCVYLAVRSSKLALTEILNCSKRHQFFQPSVACAAAATGTAGHSAIVILLKY
jgi:hypothetical protein